MLDAGGGTADATTYTITSEMPLRLATEVIRPNGRSHVISFTLFDGLTFEGKLHGSSYLNLAYEELLNKKLKPQQMHLELNGMTIQNYVDKSVWDFEHFWKRTLDITKSIASHTVPVTGVREHKDTGCITNAVKIFGCVCLSSLLYRANDLKVRSSSRFSSLAFTEFSNS